MNPPLALLLAALLQADIGGFVPPADSRVQTITFAPDQVVPLSVAPGYAAVIELGDEDRVESLVVGNAAAWQVTASQNADRVVVKPLIEGVATNLVIIGARRRYVLLLQPGAAGVGGAFVLRFADPIVAPVAVTSSVAQLATYRLSGARRLLPTTMTDDSQRTSITWAPATQLPAIYAIDGRGKEQLVNGRMIDSVFVIEGVAPRYRFRLGGRSATAKRQSAVTQP